MAAFAQPTGSPRSPLQQYIHASAAAPTQHRPPRPGSKQRFMAELSQCLFEFVIQLLPTAEEMAVKEDVRKLLERLIRNIEPDSRLLSFGSTANGFSLRNSDMDLCCLIDSDERLSATDLVTMLGDLLERETKFHVKPLPHARIPIVKLSLDPSPGIPLGIACDIGFENRLALENTRLLMCYAMVDPPRVRTLVLFLKIWSKRRKINSPYKGTLSSYGYVLLVIYFLVHVKNPPVLPNLQQMPPLRPISPTDTHLAGYNTWFFDDIDLLRQRWQSSNTESVAELLTEFFRHYSRDFPYNTSVASIRAGLLKKESKGWQSEAVPARFHDSSKDRNRLCIEDPFELDYNVGRCVTKDGLYTIRGEFMRATRILAARPERAILAIAQLCEERKEEELVAAPFAFVPPRLSPLPPQTPYTVGGGSLRNNGAIAPERLSPQPQFFDPARPPSIPNVPSRSPPEHMAPKRGKWTSPPPPEAPPSDHTSFEDKLGFGLELATSSTDARESNLSSSSNSEVLSDDEHPSDVAESDDVRSVRSFTEGASPSLSFRHVAWLGVQEWPAQKTAIPIFTPKNPIPDAAPPVGGCSRGRLPFCIRDRTVKVPTDNSPSQPSASSSVTVTSLKRIRTPRRSSSGPPRTSSGVFSWPSSTPIALVTPLPPSPVSPLPLSYADSTVFYETSGGNFSALYPTTPGSHQTVIFPRHSPVPPLSHPQSFSPHSPSRSVLDNYAPIHSPRGMRISPIAQADRPSPNTPKPTSYSHSHTPATSTIAPPAPRSDSRKNGHASQSVVIDPHPSTFKSRSPSRLRIPSEHRLPDPIHGAQSSQPHLPTTNGCNSPAPSSAGYAASLSAGSPSPTTSPLPASVPNSPHIKAAITQQQAPPVLPSHPNAPPRSPASANGSPNLDTNVPSQSDDIP